MNPAMFQAGLIVTRLERQDVPNGTPLFVITAEAGDDEAQSRLTLPLRCAAEDLPLLGGIITLHWARSRDE